MSNEKKENYISRLTREQVEAFLDEHLKRDIHPQARRIQFGFTYYQCKPVFEVFYISNAKNRRTKLYLLADTVLNRIDEEFENAWIQHLYSIYGEEYKEWYLSKKEEIFN